MAARKNWKSQQQDPKTAPGGKSGQRPPVRSRRTPPVISRTGLGVNTIAAEHPMPRRRVDVPLSSPGAEIRLPAVPVVSNKWRVLSGVLTAAILMALIFLMTSERFQVQAVEVEGVQRFQEADIIRAVGITGAPVFTVHPGKIQRDLELTFPGLDQVEIRVGWPAQVRITVQERAPVLAWNWDGHTRWVDENGVAFEPHGNPEGISVVKSAMLPPTLDNRFVDPRIVQAVQALSGAAPEGVEILFDPDHGLGWKDPRGWLVYFGFNDDDAAQKIIVYQAVVDYLQGKGITPAVINIEFLETPYFRMEQ